MHSFKPHPLALAVTLVLTSPLALAQQSNTTETEEKAERIEQIVVTGTRVAGR